jgi:hypothetical protein
MAAITPILAFGQLYRDPGVDPLGLTESEIRASYCFIYSQYRVEDSPPTVEELENEILTDFLAPIGALGIMVAAPGSKTGRIKLNHGHARYSIRPGRADVDRGASFCFEGELDGTDAYTVAFDNSQLGLTPYVNVPRVSNRRQALLEVKPTKAMVGPFEVNEVNVHIMWIRGVMCIPFDLVELLLRKDRTAREAYLVVYLLIGDNNLLGVCRPLVEFLQVACM